MQSYSQSEVVLRMDRDGLDYRVHLEREWLERRPSHSIDQRLEKLSVARFLLDYPSAWIGGTATGQDTLTQFMEDTNGLPPPPNRLTGAHTVRLV